MPCASYYSQFPFNNSLIQNYSWNFQVTTGFNNLLLSQTVNVERGEFLMLTQNTGIVAIDTTGTASFSDLVWSSTTQWTKLAEFSNWRFYLTALTNFSSYKNSFSLMHTYSSIGIYNLSISFASSPSNIFQQTVNITDCKIRK